MVPPLSPDQAGLMLPGVLGTAGATGLEQLVHQDGQAFGFDAATLAALGLGGAGLGNLGLLGQPLVGLAGLQAQLGQLGSPAAGGLSMPFSLHGALSGTMPDGLHPTSSLSMQPMSPLPPVSARMASPMHRVPMPAMRQRQRKPLPERVQGPGSTPPAVPVPLQASVLGQLTGASRPTGDTLLGTEDGVLGVSGPAAGASSQYEATLHRFLRSGRARRWVTAEWHYPAVDRPWYMRNELMELMGAVGLGGIGKLTRGEWALLREAFGRPRRFSLSFLLEERTKLEAYRWEGVKAGLDTGTAKSCDEGSNTSGTRALRGSKIPFAERVLRFAQPRT